MSVRARGIRTGEPLTTAGRIMLGKVRGDDSLLGVRRVVVFAPYFPPAFLGGGPIRTLSALVGTAPITFEVAVVTRSTDLDTRELSGVIHDRWTEYGRATVRYVSSRKGIQWWKAARAARSSRPDFLYLNSFFDINFSIMPQLLARLGFFGRTPIVMAPRGEFGRGALMIKSRKKKIFLAFYNLLRLGGGRVIWHAASEAEGVDIRRAIRNSVSIVVRADDTDLPPEAIVPTTVGGAKLRAVNVGRIVPIKGIAKLLTALKTVRVPMELDIYGPVEDEAYAAACMELAKDLPAHTSVKFCGVLPHDSVRSTLAQYDVMCFPTEGESFGHVVAEALSVGCPVMCADTTPWTTWIRRGGGVLVSRHETSDWTQAVEEYGSQDPAERFRRRVKAARTYEDWHRESKTEDHVFAMLPVRT